MRYPWILFDADGTLFDYRTAEAAALSATLAELDVAPSPAHLAAYRRFNAELWGGLERGEITRDHLQSERFRKLSDEFSLDADPVDLNARYLDNLGRRADLVDGALRLLDAVHRSRGVILITNGFSRVQRSRLAVSGLSHFFHAVVISEEVGHAKPHPGMFDAALAAAGAPGRSHVLMVGDSLTSDIRGGAEYGIDTCWFNPERQLIGPGDPAPTYEIPALDGLRDILDRGDGSSGETQPATSPRDAAAR